MEKKRIALIIDTEGWAFDNIAKQIQKNITQYEIDIIPGRIFEGNIVRLFLFCENYDLIHFMWRGYLSLINRQDMQDYTQKYFGIPFEQFKAKYIKKEKISFSVCDHLFLKGEEKWRTDEIMKFSDSYIVISQKLFDIYSKMPKKPNRIIHDGVDLSEYQPKNIEQYENIEKIIVGWVGNSKFKDWDYDEDMKGVEGIIKPAILELYQEDYPIELKLADRNIEMIPQEKMPEFYNSINLYIGASKTEGTPMTLIEAMAIGIPVITTDVGIAKEALGEVGKKYILKERTKECLKEKIKELWANKQDWKILSKENLTKVKSYDWKIICQQYQEFFESNLKLGSKHERR